MIKSRTLRLIGRTLEDMRTPELSHATFRLLMHLTCEFDGANNTAFVFTRSRHGAGCGLGGRIAFERALVELMDFGLVSCSGEPGSNDARYTLTLLQPPRVYSRRKCALRNMRVMGNA